MWEMEISPVIWGLWLTHISWSVSLNQGFFFCLLLLFWLIETTGTYNKAQSHWVRLKKWFLELSLSRLLDFPKNNAPEFSYSALQVIVPLLGQMLREKKRVDVVKLLWECGLTNLLNALWVISQQTKPPSLRRPSPSFSNSLHSFIL